MGQHSYGVLVVSPKSVGPHWVVQHTATEADARLISTAPELLEALTTAERLLTDIAVGIAPINAIRRQIPEHLKAARAAIAKATGES